MGWFTDMVNNAFGDRDDAPESSASSEGSERERDYEQEEKDDNSFISEQSPGSNRYHQNRWHGGKGK